ncbi:glycosyltransferase family 4 protein [Winogradskyella sp.]|uniref:glycosyltransferase family 4 protein n=1 Tax=Winogradskyella sp. TaxID=1883156 RepID=UPI003AB8767D
MFLTSAFPSADYPKSNAHNLRSVLNLAKEPSIKIQVIHLRSWRPWRKMYVTSQLHGLNVRSFSFPYYPNIPKVLAGILLNIYKRVLFHFILKKEIQNVDIIHTAGAAMESVVGAYISRKTGIKHVAQCMGGDVNIVLPKVSKTYGWIGFENYVNLFCCNSISLEKQLKSLYPSANSKVIYRGVNLDEFHFSPPNKNLFTKTRFLYLGGIVTDGKNDRYNSKGAVTLLNAWSLLMSRIDKEEYKVELIFAGPLVSEAIVKELLQDSPANKNVTVKGQLKIDEVKSHIAKADVVVLPSMTEGLPNVAMEAAASGRPVIGSQVGGVPEIIIDGETGFLFQPGNTTALSILLEYYIKNPQDMANHGKNARKHVVENFNSRTFTENYLKVYNTLKFKS